MTTKFFNFLTMSWFLSVLICLVIEGSYLGTTENTIINNLSVIQGIGAGGILGIPAAAVSFVQGLVRISIWDYSFYEGGYAVLRYFWLATLTPGAVWGIFQAFAYVFTQFFRI